MVKAYLPRPYPDEIVGSTVLRGCRHAGLSYKRLVSKLTGGATYLSFLMPLQLNEVAEAIGIKPTVLLQEHTMFPYVTSFMPAGKVEALTRKMLGQLDGSLSSLSASVTQAVPFRRLCKECIHEDQRLHGETYWHRSHLLPGVHLCNRHGTSLWETEVPLRQGTHNLAMPSESSPQPYRIASKTGVLETVAKLSVNAMASANRDAHAHHRSQAYSKGYLLERGSVPSRELSRGLQHFFGNAYLNELKVNFQSSTKNPWPALLVRTATATEAIPAKHILLEAFLKQGPSFSGVTDYAAPGPKPDYKRIERQAVASMRQQLKKLAKSGTRTTVPELLTQAGIWQQYRHNRKRYPALTEMLITFRASSLSERQVGRRPRKYLPKIR